MKIWIRPCHSFILKVSHPFRIKSQIFTLACLWKSYVSWLSSISFPIILFSAVFALDSFCKYFTFSGSAVSVLTQCLSPDFCMVCFFYFLNASYSYYLLLRQSLPWSPLLLKVVPPSLSSFIQQRFESFFFKAPNTQQEIYLVLCFLTLLNNYKVDKGRVFYVFCSQTELVRSE